MAGKFIHAPDTYCLNTFPDSSSFLRSCVTLCERADAMMCTNPPKNTPAQGVTFGFFASQDPGSQHAHLPCCGDVVGRLPSHNIPTCMHICSTHARRRSICREETKNLSLQMVASDNPDVLNERICDTRLKRDPLFFLGPLCTPFIIPPTIPQKTATNAVL